MFAAVVTEVVDTMDVIVASESVVGVSVSLVAASTEVTYTYVSIHACM